MNILLLNDNPVVTKLVTLSAQKTSDNLEIVDSVDDIKDIVCDLFVLDDTLYSEDVMSEIKSRVKFSRSLYICSRDAQDIEGFTSILRKPFLPTDLVELFANLSKDIETIEEDNSKVEVDMINNLDELSLDDSDLLELEDDDIDDLGTLDNIENLDEFNEIQDFDEMSLDLDSDLDIDEHNNSLNESVLDKDELQEVQELLEETESSVVDSDEFPADEIQGIEAEKLEDDLDIDLDLELDEPSLDGDEIELDEPSLDGDEIELDEPSLDGDEIEELNDEDSESYELSMEEELDSQEANIEESYDEEAGEEILDSKAQELDNEKKLKIEEELGEEFELEDNLDLETQIQSAVLELSDEDLESELDADTLLEMSVSDMDGLDALNERDIKLAIGEEVCENDEVETSQVEVNTEEYDANNISDEVENVQEMRVEPNNDGVEALKKLLQALSNEDVVASLKGMKININITLGDS